MVQGKAGEYSGQTSLKLGEKRRKRKVGAGRGLRARGSPTTYLQGPLEVTCPNQKILDGSGTDVDETAAEMIAKTRYTNFNR